MFRQTRPEHARKHILDATVNHFSMNPGNLKEGLVLQHPLEYCIEEKPQDQVRKYLSDVLL